MNQLSVLSALTGLGSLSQEQLAVLNNPALLQQAVALSKGLQPGGKEGRRGRRNINDMEVGGRDERRGTVAISLTYTRIDSSIQRGVRSHLPPTC